MYFNNSKNYTKIIDLKPGARSKCIRVIILKIEKFKNISKEYYYKLEIADESAKSNIILFDKIDKIKLLNEGDIIHIENCYCKLFKLVPTLYVTKTCDFFKLGEFCLLYNQNVNISVEVDVEKKNENITHKKDDKISSTNLNQPLKLSSESSESIRIVKTIPVKAEKFKNLRFSNDERSNERKKLKLDSLNERTRHSCRLKTKDYDVEKLREKYESSSKSHRTSNFNASKSQLIRRNYLKNRFAN